ncbi:hypothetical protein Goarm_017209 [Gossypium armourianum]|uniref:RNase H type-1 domain-containing protein n=1 Tax=Gossypium armourianum TaxID=34283 RepID=A0A7J9JEM9_9ROSI|nr:hypothetical protein [Gossypium armourianum]
MSLVSWDFICQPRSQGGLGFRHLSDQNMPFLMKIGFDLVSKSNALWVRVLWSKYGLDSINRSQCSHLRRSLAKIWPLLRENLAWAIGDGASIRCWKDSWISDVINRIISIPPPHPDSGSDKVIWAPSTSGAFSIRSAFWTLKEDTWSSQDKNWKTIWKYQGPQRNISWSTTEVVKVSTSWARQFELCFSGYKSNVSFLNHANISESTWVLLSTDGTMAKDSGHAATGGVVRDRDGNWIMGFGRYLGVCSPFEAEVWSNLDGILLLLNKGYRWTITQMDSLEVVQALTDMGMEESGITVLRRTQRIMKSEGQLRILHIPSE